MKLTAEEFEVTGVNHSKADVMSFTEMKPRAGEHSCRVNDADKYEKFARKNGNIIVDGKQVDVIYGITASGKSEIQAYRYPKSRWEVDAARKHSASVGGSFEQASGEQDGIPPSLEVKEIVEYAPGEKYARELIKSGAVERKAKLTLSEEDRQEMLAGKSADEVDWKQYGRNFLGEDKTKPEDSRMRYTYPFAKGGKAYATALRKMCSDTHKGIADCAGKLCQEIGDDEDEE